MAGIKSLENALASINKTLGGNKLFVYGKMKQPEVQVVPWGIPQLDVASNIGGCPRGKIIEIFGPESGGKSTATLKLMGSFQKAGLKAGLLDIERSFMAPWATLHGVNVNEMIYGQEFTGEEALGYARELCSDKVLDILVIDSTAALVPEAALEGRVGDSHMALVARLMSEVLPQILQAASTTLTTVVFINQLRMKPGVTFGDPAYTPGGKALKFYAHQRISVSRLGGDAGKIKKDGKLLGFMSHAKFVKNKLGIPDGEADFPIYFSADGHDPVVMLVQIASRPPYAILKKKEFDDKKKMFVWGDLEDKKVQNTDCSDLADIAEWLTLNDKTIILLDALEAKAKEKRLAIPDEVSSIRNLVPKTLAVEGDKDALEVEQEAKKPTE